MSTIAVCRGPHTLLCLLATTGLLGGAAAVAAADQSAPVTEYHVPTTDADPYGVASAPNGSTWFTEWAADKIGELTPAGSFNEYAVPTAAAEPDHIAIGPAGSVVCRDCLAGLLAGRPKDSLS